MMPGTFDCSEAVIMTVARQRIRVTFFEFLPYFEFVPTFFVASVVDALPSNRWNDIQSALRVHFKFIWRKP